MTGYMIATGPCICCKRIFGFNPHTVPSTAEITGTREPICEHCITIINVRRREHGLPEWPVPADAYEPTETL